jgi:hypothetical protein
MSVAEIFAKHLYDMQRRRSPSAPIALLVAVLTGLCLLLSVPVLQDGGR